MEKSEHVIECTWENVEPLPKVSFSQYIMDALASHPGHNALVEASTGASITFPCLAEDIRRLSHGWSSKPSEGGGALQEGQVVCLVTPNVLQAPTVFLAAACAGAAVTLANPLYTPEELRRHLLDSKTDWLVVHPLFLASAKAASQGLQLQGLYVLTPKDFGTADGNSVPSVFNFSSEPPTDWRPAPMEDEQIVALPFSSGTSGVPKGVMITSKNLVTAMVACRHRNYLQLKGQEDQVMAILPLFHVFGLGMVLNSLCQGSTSVLVARFVPEDFLNTIQKYKITMVPLVPPLALFLDKDPRAKEYDLSSLRLIVCAAAALAADVQRSLSEKLNGLLIRQGYGMTETTLATHTSDPSTKQYGSVGTLVAYCQGKVVDRETGLSLGPNQNGEVCVKGPWIMKGYLGNDEATRQTFDEEGWLRTGDIGYYDENNAFYIVDRIKELIKYKGFQVAPAELEGLLLTHEAVKDTAVVGLKDEEAGELPVAFVVLKPGVNVKEEGIVQWIADRVAPHKKLRGGVRFTDAIPKTASGKILRRNLREQINS
ncbi:uncharacterized protein LOC143024769 isoform X2 [Oratosquilla oratoria]